MRWHVSFRCDPVGRVLADRHYNRQSVGSPQFVPPGECVVLHSVCGRAVWVTLSQQAQYVKHDWPNAWINSLFRNEGAGLSSELIRKAIAATLARWPVPAPRGMVTFVDPKKVRHKRDPGRCYIRAGFRRVGLTKGGLVVLQMQPQDMPEPCAAIGAQHAMEYAA
jgi:hypothetical protein